MSETLLDYYRRLEFNPVPIALDTPDAVADHFRKRENLYERHLGLPLGWLRGKHVLEIGSNSGENALVLAAHGARITAVEPHAATAEQIRPLFSRFGLESQLDCVEVTTLERLETADVFDLVLAEGFLFTLDDREGAFARFASFIARGGCGVLSFNDRHGMLIELIRRALVWQIARLRGIDSPQSQGCFEIAVLLFGEDFARQKTSRSLFAWWRDTLVNPLALRLWSLEEIVTLVETAGCEVRSTSPVGTSADAHTWYKNVSDTPQRHATLLACRRRDLWFWLTGQRLAPAPTMDPGDAVVAELETTIDALIASCVDLSVGYAGPVPCEVGRYLAAASPGLRGVARSIEQACRVLRDGRERDVVDAYAHGDLRGAWGAPYHYVCVARPSGQSGVTVGASR